MEVSVASSKPARVVMTCLLFSCTVLSMWKGFLRFEWVFFFCFGLYYMMYLPKQKGEAFAAYLKRPRTVASVALLVAAVAGAGYNLHVAFMK